MSRLTSGFFVRTRLTQDIDPIKMFWHIYQLCRKCKALKKDFKNVTAQCISKKDHDNATLQCECWHKAAVDVKEIKKQKCDTKDKTKEITKHKNNCIKVFGVCKKLEDKAVELVHTCMHDHSNHLINQTSAEELNAHHSKEAEKVFLETKKMLEAELKANSMK